MSCDSVFHQYLQSIAEFWPVRFSLALSLAPSSSGFCNSLTNKLFGVGGGGRNRLSIPAVALLRCLILLAIQALPGLSNHILFNPFGVRFGVRFPICPVAPFLGLLNESGIGMAGAIFVKNKLVCLILLISARRRGILW